jgi:hypothetical protein
LPEGLALIRLGAYQLAGLPGREELFQLAAPGLVRRFPPLRVAR